MHRQQILPLRSNAVSERGAGDDNVKVLSRNAKEMLSACQRLSQLTAAYANLTKIHAVQIWQVL